MIEMTDEECHERFRNILFDFLQDTIDEFCPEKLHDISMKRAYDFVDGWIEHNRM